MRLYQVEAMLGQRSLTFPKMANSQEEAAQAIANLDADLRVINVTELIIPDNVIQVDFVNKRRVA